MSLLSLIAALIIEQFRPLAYRRWIAEPVGALADFVEDQLNAGKVQQGAIAWASVALGITLLVGVLYYVLFAVSPLAAFALNVLVLYLTMGFRQFSHHFTEIHLALRMGEIDRARSLLAEWRGVNKELWSSSDIARLAIERSLLASHRHVFAIVLWFVLLPGPCGAALYRVSSVLAQRWADKTSEREPFGIFAQRAFDFLDWLPQRATATAFAIVGNFEDAVHCWRTQAADWTERGAGIVLAAGAGALGVRLGMPFVENGEVEDRADIGVGADADVDFMQSAVGLVWRALVLWLLVLFMLSLASLVG
jgi:adenosylcobinamide-phosphate synthase